MLRGGEGVYVVYEAEITFYQEMAEIVIEFIEELLTYEQPAIGWSG